MTLFTHHLAIDQFKSLGRDAHLTTKWIVEQDDKANHGAGEKGDQAAEHEMRSQAQVEHPDQEHVDQRPDRYDVPHDRRDTGSDTEKAQTTRFKKFIELTKRRIVERFLTLCLRFEKGDARAWVPPG